MSTPNNSIALAAALPQAVENCCEWVKERFTPLLNNYQAIDASALFSKETTGDPYCFPVTATEEGIICGSRFASTLPQKSTQIWLGYGRVVGDRHNFQLVDPAPFHGWGEHSDMIAEMMKSALVKL